MCLRAFRIADGEWECALRWCCTRSETQDTGPASAGRLCAETGWQIGGPRLRAAGGGSAPAPGPPDGSGSTGGLIGLANRHATAKQVAVAIHVVYPSHRWPVFN